ncbi:unnamed protein product, partial [Allacma fusca]
MPTLVTQLFLGNLRDVPLLKICRLVCKSWNIEGSNSLRACSKVYVLEGSSILKNFTTLILQKALGPLQHLPSPFQNFHVEASTFTDPTFIEFVMKIRITKLNIVMDHVNARQVCSILASNKTSLTDLEIRTRGSNNFDLDEDNINDPIEFTCLKRLAIDDICYSCTHIQFVEGIFSRCKPEYLELSMKNEDAVSCFLTQDKAGNLKKLKLHVSRISRETLEHLVKLRFLGISNLFFGVDHLIDEPDDLQQLINEYSEEGLPIKRIPRRKSITDFVELEIIKFRRDFVMDPLMLRYCLPRVPKLKEIHFFWNETLSAPLLRDYLGHLERIVIYNRPGDRFQVAMAQVAEM